MDGIGIIGGILLTTCLILLFVAILAPLIMYLPCLITSVLFLRKKYSDDVNKAGYVLLTGLIVSAVLALLSGFLSNRDDMNSAALLVVAIILGLSSEIAVVYILSRVIKDNRHAITDNSSKVDHTVDLQELANK